MHDVDVAVIGGGITGLAAAYELHRRAVPFTLLERSPRLGGVVRTDQVDGFTIDAGPDSLLVQKPAALALCREIGLAPRLVSTLPPRTAFVVRHGVLHPLPPASVLGIPTRLGPLLSTGLLSWGGKARMAMELFVPRRTDTADESVASFFRRRFGTETVDCIADPLLAGIHAGDVERLSMQTLFPRLVDAERTHGSVIRAFRQLRAARAATGNDDGMFRSLPGGLEELVSALVGRLPVAAIRRGVAATSIDGSGPFRVGASHGDDVVARQVLLSVPAAVSATLLRPLDAELGQLCADIPHTSTATVALGYPRTAVHHPLSGTGFVVPRVEPGLSIMAGTWVSSKWPGRAPRDLALMRGFLGGARDPDVLARADAELADMVHRDFSTLLGIDAEPSLRRVYRWPGLNPQHDVGHRDRVAAIDTRLARLPGLHLVGAAFRGVGIPDCVAAGRAAATAAVEAIQDEAHATAAGL